MGMSFTNLHIRKTADLNISDLTEMLKKEMLNKGYVSLDRDEDSDICVVLYHAADSQWITTFSFQMLAIQKPLPNRIQSGLERMSLQQPALTAII